MLFSFSLLIYEYTVLSLFAGRQQEGECDVSGVLPLLSSSFHPFFESESIDEINSHLKRGKHDE